MTTYLGIDYGLSHLGLAIADGPLAKPLFSLKLTNPVDTLGKLISVIKQYRIDVIVLGLPEGKLASDVKSFALSLKHASSLPVYYHPETLSTKEAHNLLRALGASRKKLKNDHVYAACLILEAYLETLQSL